MSKEIIGAFIFRNEGDGCLTSKFIEHTDSTLYVESCKRDHPQSDRKDKGEEDDEGDDPFVGRYRTT